MPASGPAGYRNQRPGPTCSDRPELAPVSATLLAHVLDGLGLDRTHLAGGSMGRNLAFYGAAALPGRVEPMVALACPVAPNMVAHWFLRLLAWPAWAFDAEGRPHRIREAERRRALGAPLPRGPAAGPGARGGDDAGIS
jgi:pimeloyl-ACP methyl ester carboxylesterase